jgi:hypothetical protein
MFGYAGCALHAILAITRANLHHAAFLKQITYARYDLVNNDAQESIVFILVLTIAGFDE